MQNDSSRAPLASFDTIDLGEEEKAFRGVSVNTRALKTNNQHEINQSIKKSGDENVFDECDSKLRKKIGKFLTAKTYKKISEPKEGKNHAGERDTDDAITKASPPPCNSSDSDSESSDSDSGYLRSGYVKVESRQSGDSDSGLHFETSYFKHISDSIHLNNDSSCEPTPTSSPILPRVSISTLLGELQNEKIQSKRKALEKKIQRLQVTNTPVERPRSTTPINVHTFEEYVKEFDSPEKKSCIESGVKLQIKLPGEEFSHKHKSPRKLKSSQKDNLTVFNFNEDQLFSRTKSAVVVQDDGVSPTPSPRRVLLPPNLTPTASPVLSRGHVEVSPNFFENKTLINESKSTENLEWVAFDQTKSSEANDNWFKQDLINAQLVGDQSAISNSASFSALIGDESYKNEEEDVLTVNIAEVDGRKVVDIQCQQHRHSEKDSKDLGQKNHQCQSTPNSSIASETTGSSDVKSEQESGSFDLIQEIELEMKKRHQSSSQPFQKPNISDVSAS
ncbi:uncharacterized protein LOC133181931 [Saccostrea echinata]|uniref:uncharacterized protein LOC133181931 n=1 Tax=Saccostrea echinata TaxID=191078 RepID=UPI002A82CF30|nr:uncharacterized protein LOC133181931 [Saccostrea echinata]